VPGGKIMWFSNLFRSFALHLQRFDAYQIAVLMIVIFVLGFFLLRGYGSRSNY
jgi:hypothetical protein